MSSSLRLALLGHGFIGKMHERAALALGGALIDMGIHAIDTVRFLLGDPQPMRVRASLGTAHGAYAVDDDGVVLINQTRLWCCGRVLWLFGGRVGLVGVWWVVLVGWCVG